MVQKAIQVRRITKGNLRIILVEIVAIICSELFKL